MVHGSGQWPKAGAVGVHVVVHGRGQVGPSVIPVVQYRNLGSAGVLAGNLHRVLHSFRTGVHQHGLFGKVSGCVFREQLTHRDVGLIARNSK